MDQLNQCRARVGSRLWKAVRTTTLVVGAGLASITLPTALVSQTISQAEASYIPASDKWITLGGNTRAKEVEQPRQRANPDMQLEPIGIRFASRGREIAPSSQLAPSLARETVSWKASSACLNPALRRVVGEVAARFGQVRVNSTCRDQRHNARVGGAKRSFHLSGNAADFSVERNARSILAFLSAHRAVGGLKQYGGGRFHVDSGPRRTW
jgi:hypothetical protein